jgi:predicted  nucleic acid-binding Zn-ribbon protein
MGIVELAQIVGALGLWTAVPWVWRKLTRDPKGDAQTRERNARASLTEWQTLHGEIQRLDHELGEVRSELEAVKQSAENEKDALERENRTLRGKVESLRKRVGQLEEILKTKTTPEDMRALLAEMLTREIGRCRR